ncbi:MAG: chorion class high-cysteine HCB protein 13 [Clostridiales bacterium]|nr:chorion class high-cysteine HCB protein 13 [Clostridiales bacterium]
MSDLVATGCGCERPSRNNNALLLLVLLFCCGGIGGDQEANCNIMIWVVLILCLVGDNGCF